MRYRYLFLSIAMLSLLALVTVGLLAERQGGIALPVTSETVDPGHSGVQSAPEMEAAVQDGLRHAMDDYKYNMQFPAYSVPIKAGDWHVFNPRALMDQTVTFMDGDDPAAGSGRVQVSLTVDKGVVDIEHDLPVRVSLATSEESDASTQLSQVNVWINPDTNSLRDVVGTVVSLTSETSAPKTAGDSTRREFTGTIPASLLRQYGDADVYVVAGVTLSDGSRGKAFLPITLYESKAEIQRIGEARVEGAHLMIPFDLMARVPGGYNIRANLMGADGKAPLALLSESVRAEQPGPLSGAFKVHIATLKEKGDRGPYVLTGIHITKTLTKPDYKSGFGAYDESHHPVKGFDFEHYDDQAYVDPAMLRRLEALQRLSGG